MPAYAVKSVRLIFRRSAPGEAAAEAADGHADDAVNEVQRHRKVEALLCPLDLHNRR
jgi:hypothetical protein